MMRLYYFKELLKSEIPVLREYILESVKNLEDKQQTLDSEFRSVLATINDAEQSQYMIDNFLDDNLKYYKGFPSYLYESSVLISYSFFESSLYKICQLTRLDFNKRNETVPIANEPKKSYIHDSKGYLEKTIGLSLSKKEATWKKLDKLRDLRNFIAHSNMDLRRTKNPTDRAVKKETIAYLNRVFTKCIRIDYGQKYKIDKSDLVIKQLDLIEEYLYFVIDTFLVRYGCDTTQYKH